MRYASTLTFLLSVLLLAAPVEAGETAKAQVHHDLRVRIDPATHAIGVEDRITFPGGLDGLSRQHRTLSFLLHAGLDVASATESVTVDGLEPEAYGRTLKLRRWLLVPPLGEPLPDEIVLRYEGRIHHPPKAEGEEYARSFARSVGTIGEEGVVLTRATWWVPHFGEDLLDFTLDVTLPEGWDAVSQGARATKDGRVQWTCPHPMEEVYLIANRFTRYERSAGTMTAEAYLKTPEPNLANRYLEATVQYVDMYRRLIGRYAFSKFALVENFWETGYGMPSFTLLGPTVIRLPFILHSSYPHEILHNWWGNSVYVDWETGNWCEGLTAYLADHLIKEGQGRGVEYRRDTLKKFRSYVSEGRDLPLTQFRSRHSGATEAVGYGKSLMVFHMLRNRLGDEAFAKGLQRFYRQHLWTHASWADLARVFSETGGEDLGPFFSQWVEQKGAPALELDAEWRPGEGLFVTVRQTQDGAPYTLDVPLAVTVLDQTDVLWRTLEITEREQTVRVPTPAAALRVDLDPQFDVFRRLDAAETPAAIAELFGAESVTVVLPMIGSTDPLARAWRTFASAWTRTGGGQVKVVAEEELEALPKGAVWVLGSKNRWARSVAPALEPYGAGTDDATLRFGETATQRADHSWVYVVKHPDDPTAALGWVGCEVEEALAGLARKLPHYGKYSFLAFQGVAPDNVVKGQWPALGSPLTKILWEVTNGPPTNRAALPTRAPLARLAPAFDPARLMEHVRFLADAERGGRGAGTPGLEAAAHYVQKALEQAGLEPGGDDGSWFQTFEVPDGPDGKPVTLRNVVGVLPGTDPKWKDQSVVVGAHYDHLGLGWPDVRSGNEGQVHNGADDNASGVAILLELARVLGGELKPKRAIRFVAFSGEEWGRKGSKHYAKSLGPKASSRVRAMINLDTVGRLEGKKLTVLGSNTATEWRHIAMGVGFTTGVESNCVPEDPEGSDQVSFHEVGIPAVQLFTGAHEDYHRPTDDVEKVDADGMAKVAVFTREALVYLSQRPEPLTSTLTGPEGGASERPKPPAGAGRRVSLGTVPDFAHRGPGVKVSSVVSGSAAEAAGIQAGDLLLSIDGVALEGLKHYSEVLKEHQPGDVVTVRVKRGDDEVALEATLRAR